MIKLACLLSSPEVDKEKPTRIWVGGLESRTTEQHLEDVFGEYGPVTEVRIRSTTRDVFAFVQFTQHSDASKVSFEVLVGEKTLFFRGKKACINKVNKWCFCKNQKMLSCSCCSYRIADNDLA